ncbi:MAG: lytic transglycosylase domain-containing protein [Caulobacteraceae bacterium]
MSSNIMRPVEPNQTRHPPVGSPSRRRPLAPRRLLSVLLAATSCASLVAAQPATTPEGAPAAPVPGTSTPSPSPLVTPLAPPAAPIPYSALPPTPPSPNADAQNVLAALAAAKAGDGARIRAAMDQIANPTARQIALWALVDGAPAQVSFAEADAARRELAGWPREVRREEVAETMLPYSGLPPAQVVAWFGGEPPHTGAGALALATALEGVGQPAQAAELIRQIWRTRLFDQATQDTIIARFGAVLTADDYAAREDLLLYGAHDGPAQDLLRFLQPDQQALAQARMAVRRGDPNAETMIAALPPALQTAPGLTYERMLRLRDTGDEVAARQLAAGLPEVIPDQVAAGRLWRHGRLAVDALQQGDAAGAYAVAAHAGLTSGADAAQAQFMAGWLALTRLKDPRLADEHFAKVAEAGSSPLTQSRAYYWRGRAAEAEGDVVNAQLFFSQAAAWPTTFYGQLAARKAGEKMLTLGHDPQISSAERAAFEAMPAIRAMHYLADIGARDEFKVFAADLSDILPTAADEAMLVDLARAYGDQQASMRVVRNAAKRGFILPERGYPLVTPPAAVGGAEAAFVLGVTRQESSFDPNAHSGAGARGMMQLMPGTAEILARKLGMSFSSYELEDPQYNMRLGSFYLGQLVGEFGGSYIMAAAAYNAGPGRPAQWTTECGDPRSAGTDPLNYVECIPFYETRDYVMRVLEATEVYRARLGGGSAPLTLESDLRRGAYGYP